VGVINGATSGIAWRWHPPEIKDGGRQNEMYRFHIYMAEGSFYAKWANLSVHELSNENKNDNI